MADKPKFGPIKIDHDGPPTREDFNRLQDAISAAFTKDVQEQLQIHAVTGQYKASEKDQILIADPSAGPVVVVVQIPALRQQITVMNSSGTSANTVTIQRADGKPFGQAPATLSVDKLKSRTVACSSKDWIVLD